MQKRNAGAVGFAVGALARNRMYAVTWYKSQTLRRKYEYWDSCKLEGNWELRILKDYLLHKIIENKFIKHIYNETERSPRT